jgi:hypothetical protein
MKPYIKILIILFSSAVFLCGCGSGYNTLKIESDNLVKLKSYSIHSPIGEGWEYQYDETSQQVFFCNLDTGFGYYLSGGARRGTSINIYRKLTNMLTKNIDRQEFVNSFVDKDFMIVEDLQGLTIAYKPDINKRDTTIINQKMFYKMNYGTSEESNGQLYMYLPASFEENGIFYVFRIEEDGGEDILSSGNDFDQIKNVLATFNCNED